MLGWPTSAHDTWQTAWLPERAHDLPVMRAARARLACVEHAQQAVIAPAKCPGQR